jgi:hypothetical protein
MMWSSTRPSDRTLSDLECGRPDRSERRSSLWQPRWLGASVIASRKGLPTALHSWRPSWSVCETRGQLGDQTAARFDAEQQTCAGNQNARRGSRAVGLNSGARDASRSPSRRINAASRSVRNRLRRNSPGTAPTCLWRKAPSVLRSRRGSSTRPRKICARGESVGRRRGCQLPLRLFWTRLHHPLSKSGALVRKES